LGIDLCAFELYLCFSKSSGDVFTRAVKTTRRDLDVDEIASSTPARRW
jgi:hypothetical protein